MTVLDEAFSAAREPLPSERWIQRDGGRRQLHLPVGWPLFALFGGYPLWWVLGISEFSSLIFAVPMALHLARQGRVVVPKGLGVWLLFVFWVVGGLFVLQVHAPGTIAGASSTRYPTFIYRLLWYVAATVVMLYVVNTRRELSNFRVALALSNMFVFVTMGGLLGVLAPHLEFRSALEYVLPEAVRSNGFVLQLIHPVTAQVQSFLGYDEARPSAPFAFTNEWGLAIACFLPFFVLTWCRRDAGWRRVMAPGILLLSTLGVVYSLNRGLWLALAGAGVFVAVRYALMGRVKIVALLGGGVALISAVIIFTPLGSLVLERFAHPDSNQGRANLGSLTLSSVLQGSPIVGFGTTRDVLGNFSSIASAASATCPGCSPPPLGTQGHLWLLLFCQGLVGLGLYLVFFGAQLVRHIRMQSPYVVAALTVVIVHFITMPVYDSIGPALLAIVISVGILARADIDRDSTGPRGKVKARPAQLPPERFLASYLKLGRRRVAALMVLAVVGAAIGGVYEASKPTKVAAVQSILIPDNSATSLRAPPTIDTDAQLLRSDIVLAALAHVQPGVNRSDLADRLNVSASPNTRLVHISYTAGSAQAAVRGVNAAALAYVQVLADTTGVRRSPLNRARIVQTTSVHRSLDGWIISVTSGAMGALAVGLVFGRLGGGRRVRVIRPGAATTVNGLPVVAELKGWPRSGPTDDDLQRAHRMLSGLSVASVVATAKSRSARRVAATLDADLWPDRGSPRSGTLIVISTKTRRAEVAQLESVLQHWGEPIAGVVVVKEQ